MRRHGYTVQLLGASLGVAERTVYRWRSSQRVPLYVQLALEALEMRGRAAGAPTAAGAAGERRTSA
jgi:hypothetical protein